MNDKINLQQPDYILGLTRRIISVVRDYDRKLENSNEHQKEILKAELNTQIYDILKGSLNCIQEHIHVLQENLLDNINLSTTKFIVKEEQNAIQTGKIERSD